MPSLRQVAAHHRRILVLDAASARIQVGLWSPHGPDAWQANNEEAGIGVFAAIQSLGVDLQSVEAMIFCDGPGSILGIRTVAMALRTWTFLQPRPVYAYSSLELVAQAIGQAGTQVIADARRELWHVCKLGQPIRRLPTEAIVGESVTPEHFRAWSKPPSQTRTVPYEVCSLLEKTADTEILRESSTPDAFLHEEPSYVTWTPQVHRAP